MFLDHVFHQNSFLGVTFVIKLRSGGLLYREMGSKVDFRGLGGANVGRNEFVCLVVDFSLKFDFFWIL